MTYITPFWALLTAFIITYLTIPGIIEIATDKRLCDEPNNRSSHSRTMPTLGGIGIMAGFILSFLFWGKFSIGLNYVICGLVIIFGVGLRDDIVGLTSIQKLVGQILVAGMLLLSGVEINSLGGIFGIFEITPIVSIPLSILIVVLIVNSFNLIDGINGLSGSLAVLTMTVLGLWFAGVGQELYAIIAFSVIGATLAFLRYNLANAKIFMGDSGSLMLGYFAAFLILKFLSLQQTQIDPYYQIESAPGIALGIVMIPVFDTLRVFFIRILDKKSPFSSDRRHIHHLLLDSGLSHLQATLVLLLVNTFFIGAALSLAPLGSSMLIVLLFAMGFLLVYPLQLLRAKKIQTNDNQVMVPEILEKGVLNLTKEYVPSNDYVTRNRIKRNNSTRKKQRNEKVLSDNEVGAQ